MSLVVYTPDASKIVHTTYADMSNRQINRPVHLVQYDATTPILKVNLYKDGNPYQIMEDVDSNIRLKKGDGTIVYNPVLGKDASNTAVYVEVSQQMCAAYGEAHAVIEFRKNDTTVANSSDIPILVDQNPVLDSDINSSSEAKAIVEYVEEAKEYAEKSEASSISSQNSADDSSAYANASADSAEKALVSETNAAESEENAATSATNAAISETNAAGFADAAETSATNAAISETNASTFADNAETSATNAAASETNANDSAKLAESWAVGGTGTREGEDTNNSKYYSDRMESNLLSPKEDYDPDETYNKMDWVVYDRAIWLCTTDGTTGVAPSSTTPEWQMLVKDGPVGPTGNGIDHIAEDTDKSSGKTHVYVVYYTNGTTFEYVVMDGSDGAGGDMFKTTYDRNDNGIVDAAENIEYLGADGSRHTANPEVLTELAENEDGDLIYKGGLISGGATIITEEDYNALTPAERVGKQYAVYDDQTEEIELATDTKAGVVQLVTANDVTNPVGTALPATEKNFNVEGSLANAIHKLDERFTEQINTISDAVETIDGDVTELTEQVNNNTTKLSDIYEDGFASRNMANLQWKNNDLVLYGGNNPRGVKPIKKGTYTVSRKGSNAYGYVYSKNTGGRIVNDKTQNPFSFTIEEDDEVAIWIYSPSKDIYDVQLEKGSQATSYTEFAKSNVDITEELISDGFLRGANLFDEKNITNGYYINENGNLIARDDFCYANSIEVQQSCYTMTFDMNEVLPANFRVQGYDSNGNWKKQILLHSIAFGKNHISFVIDDSNIKYIKFGFPIVLENIKLTLGLNNNDISKEISDLNKELSDRNVSISLPYGSVFGMGWQWDTTHALITIDLDFKITKTPTVTIPNCRLSDFNTTYNHSNVSVKGYSENKLVLEITFTDAQPSSNKQLCLFAINGSASININFD